MKCGGPQARYRLTVVEVILIESIIMAAIEKRSTWESNLGPPE